MSDQSRGHGKKIGDIVHSALSSGDLSRLKDLGPAVQEAVKDIPGVNMSTGNASGKNSSSQHPYQPEQKPTPAWKGSAAPKGGGIPPGILRLVFGILGMVAFGLAALAFSGLALAMPLNGAFWPASAAFGALFLGCSVLTASGSSKNRLANRAREYLALFQRKKVYSFEELAAIVGRTPKQIQKDFRKARAKGLIQNVHTDADETCVMYGDDTYQQYLATEEARRNKELAEAERQKRLEDPSTAPLEAFKAEGNKTIRQIRAANDAIPGEEISEKLSQLEATTARIFTYVEEHPEKLPDTRKFMSYYLPTTLKLVEKYRQYDEMDFQPQNIKQAKWDIEQALDTINTAFSNLLESLFQHDTLDVSTDIDVLQKMLEQEGLTGKQFEIEGDNTL